MPAGARRDKVRTHLTQRVRALIASWVAQLVETLGEPLPPTFLCSVSREVLRHALIHLNQALHDPVGLTQCAALLMHLQDGNKFV